MQDAIGIPYWLDVAGHSFAARAVKGREALNEPFRFDVRVLLPEADFSPHDFVRRPARLRIERGGTSVRTLDGFVSRATVTASRRAHSEAQLRFEPRLARARHVVDLRVFRNLDAIQIVCQLLDEIGVKPLLRLQERYPMRAYCVQYRESVLDFIHRLLEDEGVFYCCLADHTVLLGDTTAAYRQQSPLPFRAGLGLEQQSERVVQLGERGMLAAGQVTLRDFNPEKPRLDMQVAATVDGRSELAGPEEYYDYPGEYADPGEGERKARLVAEAIGCAAHRLHGRTSAARLEPGARFELTDAGELSGELAVTAIDHDHDRDAGGFSVDFEAIEGGVSYRPPRATPVPQILNPLSAFVTGPAGEDVWTDAWGRVKVHFHWDRRQPRDEHCSDWVPVLQDNTGQSSAIPRTGWETLVHFLEGDPDRPVVMGRLYNGADPFPEQPDQQKTYTQLQSLSSPGRDGHNTILLHDLAGEEKVHFHAQRDKEVIIARDKQELVQQLEQHTVRGNESIAIGKDQRLATGMDASLAVRQQQSWTVSGSRSASMKKNDTATVGKDRTTVVAGSQLRRVGKEDSVSAQRLTEHVGGVIAEVARTTHTTEGGTASRVTIGGLLLEIAGKGKTEDCGKGQLETVGALSATRAEAISIAVDGARTTAVGGDVRHRAHGAVKIDATEELSARAPVVRIDADATLVLRVGQSEVVVRDGVASLSADTIRIAIDDVNQLLAKLSAQR